VPHHLVLDVIDPKDTPYFLWSEDLTAEEFTSIVRGERGEYLQHVYMGRLLREGRLADVWKFIDLSELLQHWQKILPHLGRQRRFWEFLLRTWRAHGLI
jgi:hypothetical protein